MPRQAFLEHFVVGVRRCRHELDAVLLQAVPAGIKIIASEGNVLDALAIEVHQVLFDLPGAF